MQALGNRHTGEQEFAGGYTRTNRSGRIAYYPVPRYIGLLQGFPMSSVESSPNFNSLDQMNNQRVLSNDRIA